LLDGGPELRIAAGKQHFLFDVEAAEGALRLYRSGNGFLTAEVQLDDPTILNIRSDISSWIAGQLHHVAISWKISAPDETDEFHLFIDGDEVPNEVTFGSGMPSADLGQIYEETLAILPRSQHLSMPGDGYIINDYRGSGLFITATASIQPDMTWINRTIVLETIPPSPNVYLNQPLIIGQFTAVTGGTIVILSQNGQQINFAFYGPSVPIRYGLATYSIAQITALVRTNFAVFKNGIELNGPFSSAPQFRQVSTTQIVEFYKIDPTTGQYIEDVMLTDTITIRTYGLLTQRIKDRVFQYGGLIRSTPIDVQVFTNDQFSDTNVAVNSGGPAFITDLPQPADPTQVTVTKVLLPRIMI